jgi:hypothetical protein
VPQDHDSLTFEIEHIIAKKHGGKTTLSNLALACFACNHYKGTDIAGRDPITRKLVPLFHPRRHKWDRHFQWSGAHLVGRTPVGRLTIAILCLNRPHRVQLRQELLEEGVLP